jgi:hypothetical protein
VGTIADILVGNLSAILTGEPDQLSGLGELLLLAGHFDNA